MKLSENTRLILANVQKTLWLKNPSEIPVLDHVIVAVGIGSLHTRKGIKDFSEIENNLHAITGQKPQMIQSKVSISNFKLREGMPSMLKVTLRGQKAYSFLHKVAQIVLPRVRDFSGLSTSSFDTQGGYTIGLSSYGLFPEIHPDNITHDIGLQISLRSSTTNIKYMQALMQGIGFVFQEK